MRFLVGVHLLAALLLAFGCASNQEGFVADDDDDVADDDVADDDSAEPVHENVITVEGGDPCGPVVSAYHTKFGETAAGLVASTVEDHCARYRAVYDVYDAVLASLRGDYDMAYDAEDGPGSCAAKLAYWEYVLPDHEALYPPGSCSLVARASDGMDEADPPGTAYLARVPQDWLAWLDSYVGDCSHVQTWEDWLAIELEGTHGDPVEYWLCYGGEMVLEELGGDSWSFAADDLIFEPPSASAPDAQVSFDLVLEYCP